MKRERVTHVLQVGELGNFAVGVASNVDDCALSIGRRRQPMYRHDREQLAERPMVEK